MKEIVQSVEKKIRELSYLTEWEIIIWIDEKLKEAETKKSLDQFEEIINQLPKAVALAFGISHYRCVLFKVTETTYERVAEAITDRHPKDRIFPREKMSNPIRFLIEKGMQNIYIENPAKDERTKYMLKLITDKNINDIYYSKVETLSGTWILVVDGIIPRKIDHKKMFFLDTLCRKIQIIEKERVELEKKVGKKIVETQVGTVAYLLNLLSHLCRNKITSIGGLCRRIDKIAAGNNGNGGNNGNCQGCFTKTQKVVQEAGAIEEIFRQLDIALHDIKKGTTLNIETVPLSALINDLHDEDPARDFLIEFINPEKDFLLLTDKRKAVKAVCRILSKIAQYNKKPIKISAKKVGKNNIKIFIEQEGIDTDPLKKLIRVYGNEEITDHSMKDFMVIVSSTLLPELGAKLDVRKNNIILTFPESR